VAGLLGLGALLSRRPAELSGGQLQRVAMGRAIARRPQAFLMDEPLSNLDAQLRSSMRAELVRMRERLKVTTIYVTHDQVEAMTLGERVAVMRDGTIQQCDTPRRLFDRPRNTFVATFIGSPPMNLLAAERTRTGLRVGGLALPLEGGARIPGPAPPTLLLGLRPGDVALDRNAPAQWPRIDAVAQAVEEYGHARLVRFRFGAGSGGDAAVEISALLGGRDPVEAGERLRLGIDAAHAHYFDPESGNALA
jgi:multiple sugar transport system ATP-binding protein